MIIILLLCEWVVMVYHSIGGIGYLGRVVVVEG